MIRKSTVGLIISFLLLIHSGIKAQTGLYVSAGASIYVSAGSTLAVDNLIFQPTSAFTIGPTTETRSTTLTHANPSPTIQRAYNFSPSISPFTGAITIYYLQSEVGALNENSLILNIHNGTSWTGYSSGVTRDAVNNFVTTTGLSGVTLSELTLAGLAGITFSGKVFLQAAYNTSNSNMDNTLNSSGILDANALSQPYNSIFGYAGSESVAGGFFAAHSNIVDWVMIQLRDAATPSTVIATRAALVMQDGTLVETDGSNALINFPTGSSTNYYISIHHRNHLGIRSTNAINFGSGTGSYDFTTGSGQSFQNQSYTSTVQTGTVWSMRAGNANPTSSLGSNNVKYNGPSNDQNQILNVKLGGSLSTILSNVYAPEDVNMNGNIKWNGPGNDQNFLLNTVLAGLLSTIYNEQLF